MFINSSISFLQSGNKNYSNIDQNVAAQAVKPEVFRE
jgi:hypothetical protein